MAAMATATARPRPTLLLAALMLLASLALANAQAGSYTGTNLLVCGRINCGDRGTCRSDFSCSCSPQWYGDSCEKYISSGSITDGGLAGIIIGWLLAVPVLGLLGWGAYRLHDSGALQDCGCCSFLKCEWECKSDCCKRRAAPSGAGWQVDDRKRNGSIDVKAKPDHTAIEMHNRPYVAASSVQAVPSTPATAHAAGSGSGSPSGFAASPSAAPVSPATHAVVAAIGEAVTPASSSSPGAAATPAAPAAAVVHDDTPEHNVLIEQVISIFGVSRAEARASLVTHNWNVDAALGALLERPGA